MAQLTKIEWTHRKNTVPATWNPWYGCHKVSLGCAKCYMFREQKRYGRDPNIVTRSKTTFDAPLKWELPHTIFTCSWSDWFIEEADAWRAEAWDIIKRTTQHTYLILTKRPERIAATLPADWGRGYKNVWLGVSAENQEQADERIPLLLYTPARYHFISAEPLLGKLDLEMYLNGQWAADWVITGGESDQAAPRPCKKDWLRSIRDQCSAAGVAYFHKQNGGSKKIDGVWGGREIDGRTHAEFPDRR